MNTNEILKLRTDNHQISGTKFKKASELVHWFGGIQGQDYEMSKWAIGVRLQGLSDNQVEKAFKDRTIIRAWLMRGTLHVVAAEDIHWITDLLAPRLISLQTPRNRQLELDSQTFNKSNKIFEKALKGGKEFTRQEIAEELEKNGIDANFHRLYHILQMAGLEHVLCFGSRRGKEFTFTLLDEAAPNRNKKSRNDALKDLAKMYFSSRGPATINDFTWWSGLTMLDAKRAIEYNESYLIKELFSGTDFWFAKNSTAAKPSGRETVLLPAFDEYIIAYKDRNLFLDSNHTTQVISSNGIFRPVSVTNGFVSGIWKRTFKKDTVLIEVNFFNKKLKNGDKIIKESVDDFSGFLNKELKFVK